MFPDGGEKLGPHRLRGIPQQGQIAMGRGTGEQIQHTVFLQATEAGQQIALAGPPLLQHPGQLVGQVTDRFSRFRWGQREQVESLIDPGQEAAVQAPITQQRQQGGREPQGEPGGLEGVSGGPFQDVKQGQVTLLQRLEVPVFLQ